MSEIRRDTVTGEMRRGWRSSTNAQLRERSHLRHESLMEKIEEKLDEYVATIARRTDYDEQTTLNFIGWLAQEEGLSFVEEAHKLSTYPDSFMTWRMQAFAARKQE